jgi:hypothetical protein
MFDQQVQMLDETRQLLGTLVCWSRASPEQFERFRVATAAADAVFGPDAAEYMDEIYFRGRLLSDTELLMRKALRPRIAPQPLRAEIAEIVRSQMDWFTNQITGKEKPRYRVRLGL